MKRKRAVRVRREENLRTIRDRKVIVRQNNFECLDREV